ncbi:unnamed protein product [Medioppia subpectinata]|uniref:Uncharacterized protein n=1 Tax=Medioppia subpectinata TaxID=1979941 RepID=A0A7R9PTX3_9ACAR|nr:unnamed protein product [Medioppia subpectinata]CAG2100914.1 unnamed protein product [Medioppia subpectinata]
MVKNELQIDFSKDSTNNWPQNKLKRGMNLGRKVDPRNCASLVGFNGESKRFRENFLMNEFQPILKWIKTKDAKLALGLAPLEVHIDPPSTSSVAPVMNEALSDAKNAMASATSSGSPVYTKSGVKYQSLKGYSLHSIHANPFHT